MFKFGILLMSFIYLAGCSCSGGRNRTDSEYVLDMMQQPSIKAQEGSEAGDVLMKVPPEGTRARNRIYYPYKNQPLQAEKNLKNPIPYGSETLAQGKVYYEKFCIYCHGAYGDIQVGATVAPKMIMTPPSLLTEKVRSYNDGRLYHIIYDGQGLMGSYRLQLETKEQVLVNYMNKKSTYEGSKSVWAVVHYIRSLHKRSQFRKGMGQ